ncbi:hypothetical protein GVAV_002993 [Gurleya vavrai]
MFFVFIFIFAIECLRFERYNNLSVRRRNEITIRTTKIILNAPYQNKIKDIYNRVQNIPQESNKPVNKQKIDTNTFEEYKNEIRNNNCKNEKMRDDEENKFANQEEFLQKSEIKNKKLKWYKGIGLFIILSILIPIAYLLYDQRNYLYTKMNYYTLKRPVRVNPSSKQQRCKKEEVVIEQEEYTFLDIL